MSDISKTDPGPSPDDAGIPAAPAQASEKWSPATDATTHEQAEKASARKAPVKRKVAAKPKAEAEPEAVKPKGKAKAKAKAEPEAAEASGDASAESPADVVADAPAAEVQASDLQVSDPQAADGSADDRAAEPDDLDIVEYPETPPPETFEGERIAKAIARAGIASRRDAEAMILDGRVTLNGTLLRSPAVNVTDADRIVVDGEPLPARERTRLWVFHKPRGLVTTARDPEGRQTVFEALPEELPRVVAVGRLDINTEGLLLLTNDGGLAKVIAHPDTGWLRRYRVRAWGDTTQVELDRLRKGVTIDGMEYGPIEATLDRSQGDNIWITLGLREGKNREVKRILEHLGLAVNRLIRLSFGPFQLGELEVGLVEEIRTKVLKEQLGRTLAEQAGVDFDSAVRAPVAPFGSPKAARAPEASSGRPRRDGPSAGRGAPSAPVKPARVATGGTGSGPRRSVWRAADEAAAPEGFVRPAKPPRRGADPKIERAAAAERGRERVGAINTGERRVVVERLKASPEEPAAEPHRRTRFRKAGDDAPRNEGFRPSAGAPRRGDDRPERGASYGDRPARSAAQGRHPQDRAPQDRAPRGDDRGWSESRPARPAARSRDAGAGTEYRREERLRDGAGERTDGGRPAAKPFRSSAKPFAGGDRPHAGGGKPFGSKPFGGKPSFGGGAKPAGAGGWAKSARPDGARSEGDRSGAGRSDRSSAGKEGGYKGGAAKGAGFKGPPKAGGFKSGGYKGEGYKGEGYKGEGYKGAGAGRGGERPSGGSAGRSGGPSRSGPGGGRPGGGGRPPRAGR